MGELFENALHLRFAWHVGRAAFHAGKVPSLAREAGPPEFGDSRLLALKATDMFVFIDRAGVLDY